MKTKNQFPPRTTPVRSGILALALTAGLAADLGAATFLRGDANGDGALDIADPISLLGVLFSGGEPLPCLDAADADDSGGLDIADPITVLEFLYRGGEAPVDPFPAPGPDPTSDALHCAGEPDDSMALEGMEGDGEDLRALLERSAVEDSRAAGEPLFVDGPTFDALRDISDGQPLRATLGESTDPFLTAFFGGRPPEPPPPAFALDAIAPAGPDGCFRVPAALIDGRSHREAPPGQFRRGDVNGDGQVDADDARILAECLDGAGPCPRDCWDAADADDDGEVRFSDAGLILQAAHREAWLPAPTGACGDDPSVDPLPPCSAGWCAGGPPGRTLSVRPEVICGPGPHRVDLSSIEEDGSRREGSATVTLCLFGTGGPGGSDEEGCEDAPKALEPGGSDPTTPGIHCRWIADVEEDPDDVVSDFRQTCYSGGGDPVSLRHSLPLQAWDGAMEIYRIDNGPGPVHYLHTRRMAANCRTPPSQLGFSESGVMKVRVNLICSTTDGNATVHSCKSTAEVEGTYRSRVEVGTSSGASCLSGPNSVDALAEDEALLKVNEQTLFSKAVAVQNGNEITTTPSISSRFGVNMGRNGLSADVGINFGYSASVSNRTGRSVDRLEAFGNAKLDLPLTVNLSAKGRVETSAFHRTGSRTRCETRVAGVWLVARTDCPVDGPLFLSEIRGDEDAVERAKESAERFRHTRLGP